MIIFSPIDSSIFISSEIIYKYKNKILKILPYNIIKIFNNKEKITYLLKVDLKY